MTATIESRQIGYYKKRNSQEGVDITIAEFFQGIQSGKEWQRHAEWVREAIGDKEEYDKRKALSPCVTIGGTFNGEKKAENLNEPSGLLAADLDHLNERTEAVQYQLSQDPYVFAVFKSIGGRGLCPIFRIDNSRPYAESFAAIADYLIITYGLVGKQVDPSSSNINRLRYVSYDPGIYVNYKAKLFNKYPRKEKKEPKKQGFIHTEHDLSYIIEQINTKAIDIAPGYQEWYKVGWSLIAAYGEGARDLFHQVSQYNLNYDPEECDVKFKYLTDTRPHTISISTFYYHCKLSGIDIMTPATKSVVNKAAAAKRQKVSPASCLKTVLEMTDATEEFARPIIEQVFANPDPFDTQETIYQQAASHIQIYHSLFYNEVSRRIEKPDGVILEGKRPLNNIYYELLNLFDGKLRWSDFERIIWSDVVPAVNPLLQFFAQHKDMKPIGWIKSLAATIDTDTGWENSEFDPTYAEYFIRKWLIGLVALAHGALNDIMLILTGPPNSGKTQFFRRLLPAQLKRYYAETKLDKGKDDEILMCEYWLLMLDELAGKAFYDASTLKALLSKDFFTLREPYGSGNVTLQRRAALCGTSNSREILNDPTGNRRIIPINVRAVNYTAYNAIDKTELLIEAYHAWKSGESYEMSKEDIIRLNEHTTGFEKWSIERQLLERYFRKPTGTGGEYAEQLQAIDIQLYLEHRTSGRKLNEHKIKAELLAMGIAPYQKRLGRDPITKQQRRPYVYDVIKLPD